MPEYARKGVNGALSALYHRITKGRRTDEREKDGKKKQKKAHDQRAEKKTGHQTDPVWKCGNSGAASGTGGGDSFSEKISDAGGKEKLWRV